MMKIIEVANLKKIYGSVVAVDDISFDVAKGEIFGLLGPNGAGKTTAVECLQALRHIDGGCVRVFGLDPKSQGEVLRQRIGSQLQESALPDRIKVWEALDLFATYSPIVTDWQVLMSQWGLTEKSKTAFRHLSGGLRQRLFIALALVNKPELVFLDEMTTGLDPAGRRVAWNLIEAIRNQGTTVVLVTHFMDEAKQLCDRLAIMNKGKIVALDTPQKLIDAYNNQQVRILFSTEYPDIAWLNEIPNVSKIKRKGHMVEVDGNGPLLAVVAAALRDHDILPTDIRVERATLEDVFLKLTDGKSEDELNL